ncbi:transcription factor SOX-5-like [Oncorhynchus kisutch]|uniref:transcription factor SOX-5-like n=1 Tax=Oncorhynchus kisutch TaxID=8019 RepID=UPI0012DDE246|nr:transcription factor SOX-5-like [Oncorhynchus kisutch]
MRNRRQEMRQYFTVGQQAQLPCPRRALCTQVPFPWQACPPPRCPRSTPHCPAAPSTPPHPSRPPYHPSLKGDETRVKQEELRLDDSNGDAYDDFDYEDEEGDYGSDNDNHQ